MDLSGTMMSLTGGLKGFLQPGIAMMLAPLALFLIAEAYDAPPPWRPKRAAGRALMLSLAFALGVAAALAVLVSAFSGASSLIRHLDVMRQIGALIIVFTGLSLLASFCRPGPGWATLPRPGGMWGGWLLGVGCGLNWSPVMGPALGDIMRRMSQGDGLVQLAVYVIALAVPFVLATLVVWGLTALLARRDAHGVTGGLITSGLLVLCGLLMLTGVWGKLALAIAAAPALVRAG